MIKFLSVLVALLPLSFATTISDYETVKLNLNSQKLHTRIDTTATAKTIDKTMGLVSKISDIEKRYAFCKIPSYNITPRYLFIKNGKRVFQKYVADIKISCAFSKKDIKKFSELVKKLSQISVVNIGNISSYYDTKRIYRNLKAKAYTIANNKSRYYSITLKKKCFMKSISFKNNMPPRPLYKSFNRSLISLPAPESNKEFKSDFSYTIECF